MNTEDGNVNTPAASIAPDTVTERYQITQCNCCGCKTDEEFLFSAFPDFSKHEYRVVRCKSCDLVYLNPRPAPQELSRFYQTEYYGFGDSKFDEVTEGAIALFVWWRAYLLKRYIPNGGRVLDVGCGRGNFLDAMSKRGFEVFGTELSEESAQRARKRHPDRIFVGDLKGVPVPAGSVDMITLWHVVEHLTDPMEYLREIERLLRPGGVVVLAQRNIESMQARFAR